MSLSNTFLWDASSKRQGSSCSVQDWTTAIIGPEDPEYERSLDCLSTFFTENIEPYIPTLDSKISDGESEFHVPVLIGGNFAFTSADDNYEFLEKLGSALEKRSEEMFGVKMES